MSNITTNITLPLDRLGDFNGRLAALGKRARRLGLDEPTASEIEGSRRYAFASGIVDDPARDYPVADYVVTVPTVADGRFSVVGVVEHRLGADGSPANMVHADPAWHARMPKGYATADHETCDHCGYRRARKHTVVVYDDSDGAFHRVGTSCVDKFLAGFDVRGSWKSRVDFLADIQREFGRIDDYVPNRTWRTLNLVDYLAQIAACVRVDGYVSRAWARRDDYHGVSTAARADALVERRKYLDGVVERIGDLWATAVERVSPADEALLTGALRPHADDHGVAAVIRDWVLSRSPSSSDEYLAKLQSAFAYRERYRPEDQTLVASAYAAFMSAENGGMPFLPSGPIELYGAPGHVSPTRERCGVAARPGTRSRPVPGPQRHTDAPRVFLGEVDDTVTLSQVLVTRIIRCRNDSLLVLGDAALTATVEVAPIKFFLDGRVAGRFERRAGDVVSVRGTVRSHGDSYDRDRTLLSPVRLVESAA